MRSFWVNSANSHTAQIHPALTGFADECCGTPARLLVYVGTLALLATFGLDLWDQLPADETSEPAAGPGWSTASRAHPAFAVSQFDLPEKTETYEILQHPQGGRKDVLHWAAQGEKPVAELEIYRPGDEISPSGPASIGIGDRMDPNGGRQLESARVIDSKFGAVALLRAAGSTDGARSCLGFIKRLREPNLQLSGWSCQGDTQPAQPAQPAAISCILSRLMLLQAGHDPKLAELFARAELKRGSCAASATSASSADWVTGAENPLLRGSSDQADQPRCWFS
jgi:hypothetical protein